ncbi:uncharacterized protein [Takifugu rubripes]|uniref:uncharacterized protein n=1 Tax=Takifugu rubripes TaxID=31033 RepID=UPI0005D2112B|nr:uncharacterized protein LOC105417503 [Takifugu rubripes]|eukprot:XP_011610008.1 PREDICTED: uncharacterized protein LOC105417503 [Takifugu rubripes]
MKECETLLICLALILLALFLSMILNIIFCLQQRPCFFQDKCCLNDRENMSQDKGRYFHNPNHDEQQENSHSSEEQENPIYGNLSRDRRGSAEICYEMMSLQHNRSQARASEPDLNYASLDLSKAKKPKKKRRPKQAQGCNNHLTPLNSFLEVDVDVEAQLPPGDASPLLSHSSIYLNAQQIAKGTEDMGRGQSVKTEAEGSKWTNRDRDGEERKNRWDGSNGDICTEAAEAERCHGDTDAFNGV